MTSHEDVPATDDFLGVPCSRETARAVVIPVPFDATCSYRPGTVNGPEAVKKASKQIDLEDHRFGAIVDLGIHMEETPGYLLELAFGAREAYEAGDMELVNRAAERVYAHTRTRVTAALIEGKIPVVLGGEHAVSLGAIGACASENGPIGVLQLDAHMDLREAYEGVRFSHASVIRNTLDMTPGVQRVVQCGIRDYAAHERAYGASSGRVTTFFTDDLHDRALGGESWAALLDEVIAALPERVYVTLDIDVFEPHLCPNTGTPVPGGIDWAVFSLLVSKLKASGKTIVGLDVVEVSPGIAERPGDTIDAIVGARALYRLCGLLAD